MDEDPGETDYSSEEDICSSVLELSLQENEQTWLFCPPGEDPNAHRNLSDYDTKIFTRSTPALYDTQLLSTAETVQSVRPKTVEISGIKLSDTGINTAQQNFAKSSQTENIRYSERTERKKLEAQYDFFCLLSTTKKNSTSAPDLSTISTPPNFYSQDEYSYGESVYLSIDPGKNAIDLPKSSSSESDLPFQTPASSVETFYDASSIPLSFNPTLVSTPIPRVIKAHRTLQEVLHKMDDSVSALSQPIAIPRKLNKLVKELGESFIPIHKQLVSFKSSERRSMEFTDKKSGSDSCIPTKVGQEITAAYREGQMSIGLPRKMGVKSGFNESLASISTGSKGLPIMKKPAKTFIPLSRVENPPQDVMKVATTKKSSTAVVSCSRSGNIREVAPRTTPVSKATNQPIYGSLGNLSQVSLGGLIHPSRMPSTSKLSHGSMGSLTQGPRMQALTRLPSLKQSAATKGSDSKSDIKAPARPGTSRIPKPPSRIPKFSTIASKHDKPSREN